MKKPVAIFLEVIGVIMIALGLIFNNILSTIVGIAAILVGYFGHRKYQEKMEATPQQEQQAH